MTKAKNLNTSAQKPAAPKHGRIILHIDMNAFYCSVHEAVDPAQYSGKPTAVSGSVSQRKGIIVTCSYPARRRGVRTGMQVREALRRCPDLILIRPNFQLYRHFSKAFQNICLDYSPLVEAMSIDECFVDITGSSQFGTPPDIAASIQRRIKEELGLPCSVGIAPNKLLAKMASDMKKPSGLFILRKRDVPRLLWHLPCKELYGVGAKTAAKLAKHGILTIGQLAQADESMLQAKFGVYGNYLKRAANGEDHSLVNPDREKNKSIGKMTTLPHDYTDVTQIQAVFLALADQVARRLRQQELLAGTVQIAIRTPQMRTISRSQKLDNPTADQDALYQTACALFKQHWKPGAPVRLLGITAQQLEHRQKAVVQMDLFNFEADEKKATLNDVLDRIRNKYGEDVILKARLRENSKEGGSKS